MKNDQMTVADFGNFVFEQSQRGSISGSTPIRCFHSFTRTVNSVDVTDAWVAPGGQIVVVSPLSDPISHWARTGQKPERGITVEEFGHFLEKHLSSGTITGDTPLGVFTSVENNEVNVAKAKDALVPLDSDSVVISQFSRNDVLEFYGFGDPEKN